MRVKASLTHLGLILLIFLFFVLPVFAQDKAKIRTPTLIVDGRMWRIMTDNERAAYVVGFFSAYQAVDSIYLAQQKLSPLSDEFRANPATTVDDLIYKLNWFYSEKATEIARAKGVLNGTLDCPVWLAIFMTQKSISASLGDRILHLIEKANVIRYKEN